MIMLFGRIGSMTVFAATETLWERRRETDTRPSVRRQALTMHSLNVWTYQSPRREP